MIFRRIVFHALLVGVLSGLVLTAVQFWRVIPIIQAAETYETAPAAAHSHASASVGIAVHDHAAHDDMAGSWAPADGAERHAYTLLSNVLTAFGFSLLMMATMAATRKDEAPGEGASDWKSGLVWGCGGFAVFWLAPALGLPPEIPGASSAALEARQLWWLLAVSSAAVALAGLAFGKTPWRWAAPALLLLPYMVGAPQPEGSLFANQTAEAAAALEVLAREFFIATATANAVFWLVLGISSQWAMHRVLRSAPSGAAVKTGSPSV